jgi:hypothetical protein
VEVKENGMLTRWEGPLPVVSVSVKNMFYETVVELHII